MDLGVMGYLAEAQLAAGAYGDAGSGGHGHRERSASGAARGARGLPVAPDGRVRGEQFTGPVVRTVLVKTCFRNGIYEERTRSGLAWRVFSQR